MEPDAAPAGGIRNPVPGRPWPAVRRHYDRLPSMAGRGGDEGRRKLPGSGIRLGSRRSPEARRQGQKSRVWRAERRHAFEKKACT